ncbi:hypothetical protein [Pseudomonas sp. PNPG3]|uniref:hypothetical protein n=1 Tax=Pseudomonas sp. PNPG3 TaxID=2919497 RepID=UPI001FFDDF39|nr:hypothetical protein [Pseudomonas sp. PNPG3]MCK2124301.1 hypothetical protein [Pseudomonas sp. PNPG3]
MAYNSEKYESDYNLISPYFDRKRYVDMYGVIDPDVAVDPVAHYLNFGANKGYEPSEFFDGSFYVNKYKDIAENNLNPFVHYIRYGYDEGRKPKSDEFAKSRICEEDIESEELNFSKWRIPCIITDEVIASFSSIQEAIASVHDTKASATILDRESSDWLIVFAGKNESFYHLNKMKPFCGNILFFRDVSSTYYSENPCLPAIDKFSSYIDYLTGPRVGRTIMIGQSFGGHSALYQSVYIKNSLTFAFSVQAHNRDLYPHNVYFSNGIKKLNPISCAPDVVSHIRNSPDAPRYVIVGMSESSHEDEYYWGDSVAAGLLAGTGKCSVIVVHRKEHPTIQYLDTHKFFNIVMENYPDFEVDPPKAARLLCDNQIYYS